MLGKNNKSNAGESRITIGTIIGEGAVFDGNISAPETIRIDGILNGNCQCEQMLILSSEGAVNGNILAQNVIISGSVDGDIFVEGKLELLSTGRINGNITARSLVIDENARFDGRCTMTSAVHENAAALFEASVALIEDSAVSSEGEDTDEDFRNTSEDSFEEYENQE